VREVAANADLTPADLVAASKVSVRIPPRSLLRYWAVRELGMAGASVAVHLGLTPSAVSRAVIRGERLAREQGIRSPGKQSA
jgi:hypothetical protein